MLNIKPLVLGELQTNCYLVWAEGSKICAVIDPGASPEKVLAAAGALDLTVGAVLLTHGHFDHVGAVAAIQGATHCAVWMSEADWSQFDTPENRFFYPLANCGDFEIMFMEEGERISVGAVTFEAFVTPGHTNGSVCLTAEDALFTGDTLFAASCGRTDLPGGDPKWMRWSLERLSELAGDYRVFPGHGPATTLSRERERNPYLRG